MTTVTDWLEQGYPHSWLPYTQMQIADMPLPVTHAEGVTLHLEDGRSLIDGISSWWSVCHGYQHPHLIEAIQKQAEKVTHIMFAGLANEPAYRLAKRLADLTSGELNRVFFSDSGSVAVEVAMKMAVQYWKNKGQTRRTKLISFRNGYHGDTMGAMSVGDPDGWTQQTFSGFCPRQYVLDIPQDEYSLAEFHDIMASGLHETAAAVIIEPLVQGAGGIKFHSADMLAEIYRTAKENDILFIADEIATGMGRTGSMFACEEAGIVPDIMCLGKGLSGGMLPLAATIATEAIYAEFQDDTLGKAFLHGPTYMGNPLACAAANASLDLFENEPRLEQVEAIEQQLYDGLSGLAHHPRVKQVRVKGAIAAVQLHDASWDEMFAFRRQFIELGVWLRPFSDVIYMMPSFTIQPDELQQLMAAVKKVLGEA